MLLFLMGRSSSSSSSGISIASSGSDSGLLRVGRPLFFGGGGASSSSSYSSASSSALSESLFFDAFDLGLPLPFADFLVAPFFLAGRGALFAPSENSSPL